MRVTQAQAAELGLALSKVPGERRTLSKYRNRKCEWRGRRFASAKERDRYIILEQMQLQGRISDLRCQVRYRLEIGDHHICDYIADFAYSRAGLEIIEDVKSEVTRKLPVYRIKRKLVKAIFGKEIIEV